MESKAVSPQPGTQPPANAQPLESLRAEAAQSAASKSDQADLRLVIEEDAASGLYVYKTVDRRTGDVVQQLPREEILHMQAGVDYAAGAVVRAKA